MKKTEDTIHIYVQLPVSMKKELEKLAQKEDRTVNGMIRYLIRKHLDSKSE